MGFGFFKESSGMGLVVACGSCWISMLNAPGLCTLMRRDRRV